MRKNESMKERRKLVLKRSVILIVLLLNSIPIPLMIKTSIESTLAGTQGVFYNYLTKMNFTIGLIILLGLINLGLVMLGFLLDEYSWMKLLLASINTTVSIFAIILWSALLIIEILVEGNYISIDLSGAFLITMIFPVLYLARSFFIFRMKREVLWYLVYILNSISQNPFRDAHQLKKSVSASILEERKGYFRKNFDLIILNLLESEQPLIKKQENAFVLTEVGAELLYKYQNII